MKERGKQVDRKEGGNDQVLNVADKDKKMKAKK